MLSDGQRLVVGAIIVDDLESPSRVLAARRTSPPELAGKWEFPGGKVETGETPREALVREIQEELGIGVELGDEFEHVDGVWPISTKYCLRLYFATTPEERVSPMQSHDEVLWIEPAQLKLLTWLPSDAEAVAALCERLQSRNDAGHRSQI